MTILPTRSSPQTECPVDVEPRAAVVGDPRLKPASVPPKTPFAAALKLPVTAKSEPPLPLSTNPLTESLPLPDTAVVIEPITGDGPYTPLPGWYEVNTVAFNP